MFFGHFEVLAEMKSREKDLIHISLKVVFPNESYGILKLMRRGSSILRKTRLKISAWVTAESP